MADFFLENQIFDHTARAAFLDGGRNGRVGKTEDRGVDTKG